MAEVSIIICTRNRSTSLRETLQAIEALIANAGALEVDVVLVDNASTDDTFAVMSAWAQDVPFAVAVVCERKPGLAAARNAGVRASTGRVLVFTDDDCRPAPDYLTTTMRHYAADPGPCIRGGRVELGDPADLPLSIKREMTPERLGPRVHPATVLIGANMTMHRAVIDRVGLFDERFGAGAPFRASEETDLLFRAYLAGIPVLYQPDMVVWHYHGRRDLKDIHALCNDYCIGGGAFYLKHIRRPLILRCLYWTLRNWARELLGGPLADVPLGISNREILRGNFEGMYRFLITPRPPAPPVPRSSETAPPA